MISATVNPPSRSSTLDERKFYDQLSRIDHMHFCARWEWCSMPKVKQECQNALRRNGCKDGKIIEYSTFKAWTMLGLSDRAFVWLTYSETGLRPKFQPNSSLDMAMCPFDDPHLFVPFHWAAIVRRCALNGIVKIIKRPEGELMGLSWQRRQFTNQELRQIIDDN